MRGLATAGRDFRREWIACLASSVIPLLGNGFAHRTDADHSVNACRRLGTHLDAIGGIQSSRTAIDQHHPANSRAMAALAIAGRFCR